MSHSAEKCKRGDPLGFINVYSVAKYQKTRKGDSETFKKFQKSRTVPKKIERGDPLVSSGFVGYVKKVKNERGTLCTKFASAGLGRSSFISFCKKWYIRDEVCGLTKKKEKLATVRVGLFSLEKRRLKIEASSQGYNSRPLELTDLTNKFYKSAPNVKEAKGPDPSELVCSDFGNFSVP